MGACASTPATDVAEDVKLQQHGNNIACDVLFFPDYAMPCHTYMRSGALCRRPNCRYAHEPTSLIRLLNVIKSAKKTLEVCVFTITCNEIADAIEEAAGRGVHLKTLCSARNPLSKACFGND